MTQGRGDKANDLLRTDLRDASDTPAIARAGEPPAPSTHQRAHLLTEHGLKLVPSSTARPVFTKKEMAKFNAVLRGEYP